MSAELELTTKGTPSQEADSGLSDRNTLDTSEHAIVFSHLTYSVKKLQYKCPPQSKTTSIIRDVSGYVVMHSI